jgi:hypothetical protein
MTSAFPSALPGTRPARRVHVPPVPSGTFPDPGGRDAAERAHRLQRQTADLYTRWRASFPQGIDPDELKDNAGVFAYSDPALALEPALTAVKADADAASHRVSDAVKTVGVPDDQAAQAQRIWARTQRRLDAAKGVAQKAAVAQDLISGAEGLTLGTLREELPDYLESEGVPTSWLPAAFAARVPDAADAVADATRLAKAQAVLLHNHNALTKAFAKDVDAPPLLDPAIATTQAYSNPTGA